MQTPVDLAVLAEIGLLYLRNKNLEAQLQESVKQLQALRDKENLGRGTAIETKEMEDRPGTPAPIESCQ